jgi:DNA-binding YbaB/EbfC family protein
VSKFQNLPKGMLEQLHVLQQQLVSAQLELDGETVTGTAGDGGVQVILTGDQKCTQVLISPKLLAAGDPERLGVLLAEAFNEALEASRELMERKLNPFAPEGSGGARSDPVSE